MWLNRTQWQSSACVGLVTLWLAWSWWGMHVLHSPGARLRCFVLSPSPSSTGARAEGQLDWLITDTSLSSSSLRLFPAEVMVSAFLLFVFSLDWMLHCETETAGVKCNSCSIHSQNKTIHSLLSFTHQPQSILSVRHSLYACQLLIKSWTRKSPTLTDGVIVSACDVSHTSSEFHAWKILTFVNAEVWP